MNTEPSGTNNTKSRLSKWKLFFQFITLYFILRLVADLAARRPIGGKGGWSGLASLAIETTVTGILFSFLFSIAWQRIIDWRHKHGLKQ